MFIEVIESEVEITFSRDEFQYFLISLIPHTD